jgi:hypothetical protein
VLSNYTSTHLQLIMSPYIENYGITETEYDEVSQATMNPLHPEIQAAIDHRTSANVDGDHYNATLEALASLGYSKGERLAFKDPSIKGVSYHSKTHRVDVSKADFLGVFTDIQFHTL